MISYKQFGFVNTVGMLKEARENGYAVPAYNFSNLEQLQAIILACLKTQSPVILAVSPASRQYADPTLLRYLAQGAAEMMKRLATEKKLKKNPLALHFDHGLDYESCAAAVEAGFSSVMIDGSALSYEKNVALTKKVAAFAHRHQVTVEGELGVLAGVRGGFSRKGDFYTRPEETKDFVKKTGVDSLAVSIGTSHGVYKFKAGGAPRLRLDILREIRKKNPALPLVLHGASLVASNYVKMINQYGGRLRRARGVPAEQLRQAVKSGICKINIDSDTRLAMTAIIRKILSEDKQIIDPRRYLGPAREALQKMYIRLNREVFGSAGRV